MYTIYVGEVDSVSADAVTNWRPVHHPALDSAGLVCDSPVITDRLNAISELTFDVYPTNPLYDELKQRKTYVSVRDDGAEIWSGRIIEITKDLRFRERVVCESNAAYLLDTVVPPFSFSGQMPQLVQKIVQNHNIGQAQSSMRWVSVGTVTAGQVAGVEQQIQFVQKTAQNTWQCLQSLVKQFGGYVRTRISGGATYLDYVNDFQDVSDQAVEYGKNLLDFSQKIDASDVVTCVLPYGATKNKPPVLYRQQGTSGVNARTFKRYTAGFEDSSSAGKYLLVANGGAMHNHQKTENRRLGRAVELLVPDRATFEADDNGVETIVLTPEYYNGTGQFGNTDNATNVIWTIAQCTTPGKSVNATTKTSLSISDGGNNNIVENEDGTAYATLNGALLEGSRAISTMASVSTNTNDAWRIGIKPSWSSVWRYLEGGGKTDALAVTTASFSKAQCWDISNNEQGATIKNKWNAELGFDSAIHGDVDTNFYVSQNASGNKDEVDSCVTVKAMANPNVASDPLKRNIVVLDPAVTEWGYIYGTKTFENVNTPFDLLNMAQNWINTNYAKTLRSISVSAIDLSAVDVTVSPILAGTYADVKSPPHNLQMRMLCTQRVLYLTAPEKTKLSFGVGKQTITDLQGRLLANVS